MSSPLLHLLFRLLPAGLLLLAGGLAPAARAEGDAIPVVVATVKRQDMPVYLDALGKVQAMNTVTVRTQVDGKIEQIAFRDGQEVHAGDLLVQIDPRPYQAELDQTLAKRDQDLAQLAYAERVLERDSGLMKQGSLDQQTYDLQQATVAQLKALTKADDATVASARVRLDFTHITAPITGRVGLRLIDQGNLVRANDATGLLIINQIHPITVVFTLPEQDFQEVHTAARRATEEAPLTALALERNNQEILDTGRLDAIDNQIDEASGTIRLKAVFENKGRNLWPGQFVNLRLRVAEQQAVLVVPTAAVKAGADGDYVYTIGADNTAALKIVKVAHTEAGLALVASGLTEGERVVVDGQYLLQPKVRVQIKSTRP
ncbi:efflux RND transporter periplasmic adaptor subunit [Opitutus sp. GAS368]|jgi:multidrug efflux system membrane fusion protein|uniref:efflux RND transporter periplasmic adaptor subunit n=1 Tax=Opitutus sp. GAS368 TaxID=1882749 RepID=UPI00087D1E89|nr:efflux RND transporter periplasmic adaptor subunit [Opitutus sp. GAS368]SDR65230.1 membrane fusion protein, multidrug efflux system [Opitutus sp. GAS368]